eukprot:TRINITY_DN8083_c0_g1_i1.p1 TRINITY_DN8083_c0_g1~~TRINITY_DN8083_c0_g1_i1.p1  ORF type:complete len:578 (+),score=58.62 TRINITY_DN8083_c0_g1_i1:73-1806(+)
MVMKCYPNRNRKTFLCICWVLWVFYLIVEMRFVGSQGEWVLIQPTVNFNESGVLPVQNKSDNLATKDSGWKNLTSDQPHVDLNAFGVLPMENKSDKLAVKQDSGWENLTRAQPTLNSNASGVLPVEKKTDILAVKQDSGWKNLTSDQPSVNSNLSRVLPVGNSDRRNSMEKVQNAWKLKLTDHVSIDRIVVAKFDSKQFVKKFSGGPNNLTKNDQIYASFAGTLVTLPSEGFYFHFSRVVKSRCKSLDSLDGVTNFSCLLKIERSVIYAEILDNNFTSMRRRYNGVSYPRVLEIPSPRYYKQMGPEDPRAILDEWGNIIITFAMRDPRDPLFPRTIWNYNITTKRRNKLTHPFGRRRQKNWAPVYVNGTLLYGCGWNPILFLDCNGDKAKNLFRCRKLRDRPLRVTGLRGGSALTQYRSFYVGMFRTTEQCERECGRYPIYRPRLVILDPSLQKFVYISESLTFKNKIFLYPFWEYKEMKDIKPRKTCYYTRIVTVATLTPTLDGRGDWITEFSILDQKNLFIVFKNLSSFMDIIIDNHKHGKIPNLVDRALYRTQQETCLDFQWRLEDEGSNSTPT